jgi:hypothetical protein
MEIPVIPASTDINDIRTPPQFRGISFSGFKKTDVQKQMTENMKKGKVEQACYWCAELICAGHFADVWEIIFHYFGKHIHQGNPKIALYLQMRYGVFKNIMENGKFTVELNLRNNKQIRQLFAEIISILTISNKTHSFEPIKINRQEEFDLTQMSERLKADSVRYAEPCFLKEDSKELYIAMNEFAYHLSAESQNSIQACYWIEWVIDFDMLCKKRKEPTRSEYRAFVQVETKYKRDTIWILWDLLFHYSAKLGNAWIDKIMRALFDIFCAKYTTASCKKRRYLLYYAVGLVTQPVCLTIEVITNKTIVQNVVENIETIYKQITKNKIAPNTEYLFSGLQKERNFEDSMKKMDIMNSMDFTKP